MNGGIGEALTAWLERSREVGFLGPGPVAPHVDHALGFAEVVGEAPTSVVDLGSGGGVPGLVLADLWSEAHFVLLDSSERRTDFLRQAVTDLGWGARVQVVRARAEQAGRDESYRGWFDVVVSRSFGSPPVTAECAAPLLRLDGRLIVSEPPENPAAERWPAARVALLGLRSEGPTVSSRGARYAVLRQESPCSVKFPRREGVPAKRPLW